MLHEILLSLSGHPSPLLTSQLSTPQTGISPPERQLLEQAAHLSDIHIKLSSHSARIASAHPSAVCRAVATAVKSTHLAAFQRKVLDVEASILQESPDLVGAYNIVPLTAVMGEFKQWTRRMDWLWEVVQYMSSDTAPGGALCGGATIMERLRIELQSGYKDVKETALTLVAAGETTWLRQVSAWILYGKLPVVGGDDFFIQATTDEEGYAIIPHLLPSFVTPATASSMLFIGKSINQIRARADIKTSFGELESISANLRDISSLTSPVSTASLAKVIGSVRRSLSEKTLQAILPVEKVASMLTLLRGFLLLGRGEFAMAVSQEADERIRNRWRQAITSESVVPKDGEVAAVLTRAWASLASMQRQQSDDDPQMDLARQLLHLRLVKTAPAPPAAGVGLDEASAALLAASPFNKMLFSVPSNLYIHLPSPIDMVISPSDLQLYSCLNSYLLSLRRAHIRLSDLWKLTSLRRHHPAPRGAGDRSYELRERWSNRTYELRSTWTTASAAMFFLGETEAYFQTEVVEGMWQGFYGWLSGDDGKKKPPALSSSRPGTRSAQLPFRPASSARSIDADMADDATPSSAPPPPTHDQQALSAGHTLYLRTLSHRLLLTKEPFTTPLYNLLVYIDYLVAHVRRLHSIYTAADLEADAGVVDSEADLAGEEAQVTTQLRAVERKVRRGIEAVVDSLEMLSEDVDFLAEWEGEGLGADIGDEMGTGEPYRPGRVGGIDRLLMKLDFGTWFGQRADQVRRDGYDEDEDM